MKKRKGLIILMAGLLLPVCVNAATHMVDQHGRRGAGSLRAAVAASNAEGGMSQIRFDSAGQQSSHPSGFGLDTHLVGDVGWQLCIGQLVLSAPASAHLFIFRPASANDSHCAAVLRRDSVAGTRDTAGYHPCPCFGIVPSAEDGIRISYSRIYPVDDKWKVRVDSCQFANCSQNNSYAVIQASCHYLNVNGSLIHQLQVRGDEPSFYSVIPPILFLAIPVSETVRSRPLFVRMRLNNTKCENALRFMLSCNLVNYPWINCRILLWILHTT